MRIKDNGKIVEGHKVEQYEAMCHHMIRKYLPSLALWEASMAYEDLLNQLRYEVFMALKFTFDPEAAMTSTIADPIKREAQLKKKLANPEKALIAAEKIIVYERLKNYMRRTLYKFHPNQRGGLAISLEAMVVAPQHAHSIFNPDMESMDINGKKEELLDLLEISEEEVRKKYNTLSKDEKDSLIDLLNASNVSMLGVFGEE